MGNQDNTAAGESSTVADEEPTNGVQPQKDWDLVALTPTVIKSEHKQYADAIIMALDDPFPGNGVRIDKGNPNNSQITQQGDHVVVRDGGKVIGRDGQPLPGSGSIKENPEMSHIPLEEWKGWTTWNKP